MGKRKKTAIKIVGIKFLFKSGTRSCFNFEKLKIIKIIDGIITNILNFI